MSEGQRASDGEAWGHDGALGRQRARLLRLCARLTGRPDIAEDLTQETLLEAWRHRHQLRDPGALDAWLAGIARNVCRRWLRRHARERGRLASGQDVETAAAIGLQPAGSAGAERLELSDLLERALDRLPAETGRLLWLRYGEDLPQAELARLLGASEGAVAMRLARARQALRQVLAAEDFQPAVASCGLAAPADGWRRTQLWCPICGVDKLLLRFSGSIAIRCPACHPDPELPGSEFSLDNPVFARLIGRHRQPRAVLRRASDWSAGYFARVLADGGTCTRCGEPVGWSMVPADRYPYEPPRCVVVCQRCGEACSSSLSGYLLSLPEAQRFWQAQQRIRTLPAREVETAAGRSLVVRLESLASAEALDFLVTRQRYTVCGLHHNRGARPSLAVGTR